MIKVALGACMVELGRHNRLKICRPKGVPVRVRLQAPFYSDDLTFLAISQGLSVFIKLY